MPEPIEMTMAEVVAKTGITYPNPHPYTDVTLLVVAWNEGHRIEKLLAYLKPYFLNAVICVQESTDDTLAIAQAVMDRPTDRVITDKHWGHGDASFPKMLRATGTTWAFVVSCDEWPQVELLDSIWSAIEVSQLDHMTSDGVWFTFRTWIDEFEASGATQLRLFKTKVGWPGTLHSRPMTHKTMGWPHGIFEHRVTFDEMMRDYLSYYRVGKGHPSWELHNTMMMRSACIFIAERKGWDEVTKYEWWPEVRALAFGRETPWEISSSPQPPR